MKTYLGNLAPLPGNDAKPHPVDIVFHLGREGRFGGWGHPEWTVLHHSMLTAMLYLRVYGHHGSHHALLHDAHEYMTGDVPTPVKRVFGREGIEKVQSYLDDLIYNMLLIRKPCLEEREAVKVCDLASLIIEAHYFGQATLPFEHLGEMEWRKQPKLFQEKVAFAVKVFCPEVYAKMLTSHAYNPGWEVNPWGMGI